ncbi:MAG TPA: hypothetical protein VF753_13610 [Terriglobales bacterium]
MFARKVCVQLKTNTLAEFGRLMDDAVVPWLETQEGFLGLVTLAAPDNREVQVLSFWDHAQNAQVYSADGYPTVLTILGALIDEGPSVKIFDVIGSGVDLSLRMPERAEIQPENTLARGA